MIANTWNTYDIQMYPLTEAARDRDAMWANINAMASERAPVEHLRDVNSERAETIITSMLVNRHDYEPAVNIPNRGNIVNLPDGAIVEVPAVIDAAGVHGLALGPLPEPVAELCRRQIAITEMAVRAGVTGDHGLALQALAIDPMIADLRTARKLFDDYLAAEKKYLPQFFSDPKWLS
jgi:alpha-galactosidase